MYLSATLNVGVWRHLCLGLDFEEGRIIVVENGEHIADISHYRYYQRWCTFFKPVPLLETLNLGPFWPFLAILSQIYALFSAPFTGLHSVVMLQN